METFLKKTLFVSVLNVMVSFPIVMIKYSDKSNLREKKIILAPSSEIQFIMAVMLHIQSGAWGDECMLLFHLYSLESLPGNGATYWTGLPDSININKIILPPPRRI